MCIYYDPMCILAPRLNKCGFWVLLFIFLICLYNKVLGVADFSINN